jgi:hypothetical protein
MTASGRSANPLPLDANFASGCVSFITSAICAVAKTSKGSRANIKRAMRPFHIAGRADVRHNDRPHICCAFPGEAMGTRFRRSKLQSSHTCLKIGADAISETPPPFLPFSTTRRSLACL